MLRIYVTLTDAQKECMVGVTSPGERSRERKGRRARDRVVKSWFSNHVSIKIGIGEISFRGLVGVLSL